MSNVSIVISSCSSCSAAVIVHLDDILDVCSYLCNNSENTHFLGREHLRMPFECVHALENVYYPYITLQSINQLQIPYHVEKGLRYKSTYVEL